MARSVPLTVPVKLADQGFVIALPEDTRCVELPLNFKRDGNERFEYEHPDVVLYRGKQNVDTLTSSSLGMRGMRHRKLYAVQSSEQDDDHNRLWYYVVKPTKAEIEASGIRVHE